jgi:hypothetical protein
MAEISYNCFNSKPLELFQSVRAITEKATIFPVLSTPGQSQQNNDFKLQKTV